MYEKLKDYIKVVPDFPKPGVSFKDICPLLESKDFSLAIDGLSGLIDEATNPSEVLFAGVESRGFLFASALAYKHATGCMLIRKKGKLPKPCIEIEVETEYSSEILSARENSGKKVILVDDVLATGQTAIKSVELLGNAGCEVLQSLMLIDLPYLHAKDLGINYKALLTYDS